MQMYRVLIKTRSLCDESLIIHCTRGGEMEAATASLLLGVGGGNDSQTVCLHPFRF